MSDLFHEDVPWEFVDHVFGVMAITTRHALNALMNVGMRRYLDPQPRLLKWRAHVDYTMAGLIARLAETMPAGFTWQHFLDGALHLDHIRPLSSFRFTSTGDAQFAEAWSLDNLRLLPAAENLRRGRSQHRQR